MKPLPYQYQGSELDLFLEAKTWREYWASILSPYLGTRVLEVGAGIGAATRALLQDCHEWVAVEPDPKLVSVAERQSELTSVNFITGYLCDVPQGSKFDSILYIDVLEHIQEDLEELGVAARMLEPGGRIIVLAPAHNWLFTPFDRSIGHFRRYTAKSLRKLRPEGLQDELTMYLDSVGILASAANRLLLRSTHPTPAQIRFWDSFLVPLSRVLDLWFRYRVGKSVVIIWRKSL